MLRRSILAARPLTRPPPVRAHLAQVRQASASWGQAPKVPVEPEAEPLRDEDVEDDPGMNGNYPNPPPVKRSLRDPYEDWWDPQERRNYGEPIHEDNDILGVFSTDPYPHFTPGWGAVLVGSFVASILALCGVVSLYYPDTPAVPRRFPGGLDKELGGPGAVHALSTDDE